MRAKEELQGPLSYNEQGSALKAKLKELDKMAAPGRSRAGSVRNRAMSTGRRSESASQGRSEHGNFPEATQLGILQEESELTVPSDQLSYLLTGMLPSGKAQERSSISEACSSFIDAKRWSMI